ncbi:hypothetical protein [Streptomyces sp. ML-6]|uniref:hypothetical protein n=1 Tax=Streptomyces sp. ML-6 TaxID=2982693 RepID=UPI0024BFE77A|nr:hypothetical protein [Streptomyces sp. ML-6]MDK0524193.1 hypothetical protein [Streptomyces sp. ML-6]
MDLGETEKRPRDLGDFTAEVFAFQARKDRRRQRGEPGPLRPSTSTGRVLTDTTPCRCFEDETGFHRRPPRGRTRGRRGRTPVVTVGGRRPGLSALRPGSHTRLCHRLRTHPVGKGQRRSMGERDFIALADGATSSSKHPSCWSGTA